MTELEAIQKRHSVRKYLEKPISEAHLAALQEEIDACNEEGGLNIQLVTEEPKAFSSFLAKYGRFSGVRNYICMIGPKTDDLDVKLGWYGERLVLKAQQLGLNTCWVGLSYKKIDGVYKLGPAETLRLVISIGYGVSQGKARKSKEPEAVMDAVEPIPLWFMNGINAALLAPTAVNQQKFMFVLHENGTVSTKCAHAPYAKVDLGIAKYHFMIGAGQNNFRWAEK